MVQSLGLQMLFAPPQVKLRWRLGVESRLAATTPLGVVELRRRALVLRRALL